MLIVVVSDEPEADARLDDALARLTARHDVMWAMVPDMPAAGVEDGGYDVATGRPVLGAAASDPRVMAAYRRAEERRTQRLAEMLTANGVPHATVTSSGQIRSGITDMTRVWSRAG